MKVFFVFLVLLAPFSQSPAQAFSMKCKTVCTPNYGNCENDGATDGSGFGMHMFLFGGEGDIRCTTNKGKNVWLQLVGVGPGMRVDWMSSFKIVCPTISHARLEQKLAKKSAVRLYGPEVAVGLNLSGKVGIYGNLMGGMCVLLGTGNSAGFSAAISEMKIMNHYSSF